MHGYRAILQKCPGSSSTINRRSSQTERISCPSGQSFFSRCLALMEIALVARTPYGLFAMSSKVFAFLHACMLHGNLHSRPWYLVRMVCHWELSCLRLGPSDIVLLSHDSTVL